jgi:uncharacterized protein (TIRG00374 family)
MADLLPPAEGGDESAPGHRTRRWPSWLPPPKFLFAGLIFVALVLLAVRVRGDFVSALRHLSIRRLPWLAAAIGAEILSFLCYAAVQRRLLFAGGARLGRRTMLRLAVAATGLTNLVPGGTAPASGWLVGQYRRHGIPMPLALWAVLAGGFAATVSVLLLLLAGATIAGLIGVWATVACAVALVAGTVGLVASAHHVRRVDEWLRRHCRVPGVPLLQRAMDRIAGVMQFRASVSGGAQVFVLSIGNWGLDVVCLATAFAVLDLPVPWRAVLFAYATAQIAGSLAPVPGGIGFVEGGMIGAFALAGTPTGNAIVATVIYRLITTWGVAAIGSLALVLVNHRRPEEARLHGDAAALAHGRDDELSNDGDAGHDKASPPVA